MAIDFTGLEDQDPRSTQRDLYPRAVANRQMGAIVPSNGNASVIDARGLVSTANFQFNSIYSAANIATTSTSYSDVTGSSMTLTLPRSARVLILFTGAIGIIPFDAAVYTCTVAVTIDGTNYDPVAQTQNVTNSSAFYSGATHTVQTLSAGAHTIKLQIKSSGANGQAFITKFQLSYLVLGI